MALVTLVAIAGSQGAGKSTIIDKLKHQGFLTVERKTSRSILGEWGVNLQEVNSNPDLTIKFQDEIIKRKFEDEQYTVTQARGTDLSPDHKIIFTERTFADLFTYALVSLGKDNQYSEWLNEYYKKCMQYQQHYDFVYYLTAGHFAVEHDGVRGSNRHYSSMVDVVMKEYTHQMTHVSKLTVVDTPVLDERVTLISSQMRNI